MKRALFIAFLLFGCSAMLALAYGLPKMPVTIKAETLSGTLFIVNHEDKVIYLKTADGIAYNFHVTGATVVTIGGQTAGFEDLTGKIGSPIEVTFRPLSKGNLASKIAIP
jgi:hypothetical protein